MTDLDTIKEMFTRAKIDFEMKPRGDMLGEVIGGPPPPEAYEIHGTMILVEEGYCGFYSLFSFRPDGSLESVEAYE